MSSGHVSCCEHYESLSKEAQVQEQKCAIHGTKLVRPPRPAPSFSWATGYSSLENLAPIKAPTLNCPEPGCDYHEEIRE